jgi:hypothetical protein
VGGRRQVSVTLSATFSTKLARFQEEQERKRMSKRFRKKVADFLFEKMQQSTDPMVIAALANQLAKYVTKPKQPIRRRGTQNPIKVDKTPSLGDLVAAVERKRKGLVLSETEKQMVAAVENHPKKAQYFLNNGSPEVA